MTPNLSKLSLQLYPYGGEVQGHRRGDYGIAMIVGAIWKVLIEKLWCGDVGLWE